MNGNVLLVKKLLECGASQPYHSYVEYSKKMAGQKTKKIRQMDSKLTAISESAEGEDGPTDEAKEHHDSMMGGDGKGIGGDDGGDLSEESVQGLDFTMTQDYSIDYTKNTPLLWATHSGHLRVVWLLLSDGYSPSDIDKMLNNALHLAAAYGDVKILQVLINDGANANAVNYYKNKPIDMAKNKSVRDLLAVAMEVGASMTDEDRRVKHEQNLRQVSETLLF
jgi:ankyrin repeat protein